MADPLNWKAGEGYDIHILRGGAASKSLAAAFDLPANADPSTLRFDPGFDPTPGKFGVTVNATTGEAIASPPPTNASRVEINNFLITASVKDNASKTYSTELRVYVHDAIDDIWLTPSTVTIRVDSDKTRFTVLAAFSDGVIGDITDWLLTYRSVVPGTSSPSADVLVGSLNGALTAVNAGKTADVTVTVVLPSTTSSVSTMTSAPARVTTKESWLSAAASTSPTFIVESLRPKDPSNPQRPGTVTPNKADPNSAARNSVASVIANAANILFISEGFSREDEFNELVNSVVKDLRTSDLFQPFKLLQDSINYWSVFVPSHDDGITLLGDYVAYATGVALPLDEDAKPASSTTDWSVREMMHEVGMPVIADPTTLSAIAPLWTSRYGAKAYTALAAKNFNEWRQLARPPTARVAVLNDHDTAFGMRNYDRQRAARWRGPVDLGSDPRRTPDVDIFKFIENLTFGGRQIGSTWTKGKDKGRLCFICKTQKHSGTNWGGYFLASTGEMDGANVKSQPTGRNATSFILDTPALQNADKLHLTMTVAHETGHSFRLGDEYGDGAGTFRDVDQPEGNLLPKKDITTTSGTPPHTVYDKTAQIKWLWPRVNKAAMLNGKPKSTGTRFKVPLQKGHGKPFAFQDIVKFRINPVRVAPTQDALFNFAPPLSLIVTAHSDDELELGLGHPGGLLVDLDSPNAPPDTRSWSAILDALFTPDLKVCLVCPVMAASAGTALLVADAIRTQIATSHGPLNAPPGNTTGQETQQCKANYSGVMTPTNLPMLKTKPAVLQDIIGIYEGGGRHDCGVFRPAGRCKMRQGATYTIPFCHVCRYIIVDTLDPTQHGELDKLYPAVAP
jgi:hypothetical protein